MVTSWWKSIRADRRRPERRAGALGFAVVVVDFAFLAGQPVGLRLVTRDYWVRLAAINLILWIAAMWAANFIGYARAWRARQG